MRAGWMKNEPAIGCKRAECRMNLRLASVMANGFSVPQGTVLEVLTGVSLVGL
jgi:hypothetical protein